MQAEPDSESTGIKGHLSSLQLISIGIGAIIGAGIFVISGQAAAQYAGPAVVLSFIIAAAICAFAGLCYAELSSLIPVSGGSYSYSYVALGEFPAWIVGWAITAQAIASASTVAVGWSGYFVSFLHDWGLALPKAITSAPFVHDPELGMTLTGSIINVPAVALIALMGLLIARGIKGVARFNTALVVIKLAAIIVFVAISVFYIKPENWTPLIPENTGVFGQFGWSGILRGAGLLFFAYLGFDTVSTLAQDAKNPQRDLPRGILGSLGVSTIAYILIALTLTGIVSYKLLNVPDPISVALNALPPKFFFIGILVKLAILSGLATVVLIQLLGQTRVFFAISRDGLLPKAFSSVNKKTNTPLFTAITTAVIAMAISGFFSVDVLGQLVSMTSLFLFATVCFAVLVLRRTHPTQHRPFRVPFVPLVPILGMLACIGQMCFLPLTTWAQVAIWFGLGIIFYLTYSYKNSKLRQVK